MLSPLMLHTSQTTSVVSQIVVDAARPQSGRLELHYILTGDIGALAIPSKTEPARRDDLWRATCFEAFVQAGDTSAYSEFNFAPSSQWAAYSFSAYRKRLDPAPDMAAPIIETQRSPTQLELHAALDLRAWPALDPDVDWRLGLSAVIEDRSGAITYWALAHGIGAPDFHNALGFNLTLPGRTQI
jgi:hypothetical protein